MKRQLILIAMLLTATTVLSQANSIATSFEEFALGANAATVSAALEDVDFLPDLDTWQVISAPAPFTVLSGKAFGDFNGGGATSLLIQFDDDQTQVSFGVGVHNGTSVTITGYEDGDFVFAQAYNLTPIDADDAQADISITENIDAVEISTAGESMAIDRFGSARVRRGLPFEPGDDRLNRQPGAPLAVYCGPNDSMEVYLVSEEGDGIPALTIDAATLYSVPASPTENTLIAEGNGIRMLRLVTRDYQIESPPDAEGKIYVFVWNMCPPAYIRSYMYDPRTNTRQLLTEEYFPNPYGLPQS